MNRIVILAHTRHQVDRFVSINHLRKSDVLYASRPEAILGIRNCMVIYLEGWSMHPDCDALDEYVRTVKAHCGVETLNMSDDDQIIVKLPEILNGQAPTSRVMEDFIYIATQYYSGR